MCRYLLEQMPVPGHVGTSNLATSAYRDLHQDSRDVIHHKRDTRTRTRRAVGARAPKRPDESTRKRAGKARYNPRRALVLTSRGQQRRARGSREIGRASCRERV